MSTQNISAIEVVKTISGNSPLTLTYPEAASQTFKQGALLTLNASGFVIEATSPNPNRILGVAAEDGHNYSVTDTTQNKCKVWIADDDTIFKANLTSAQVSALTDVGAGMGLTKVGDNWTLDKTTAHSSCRALVNLLDPRHAIGDTSAWEHFQFLTNFTLLFWTS